MTRMSLSQAAKVLNIKPTATNEEIKQAYKKRSLETHPDRGGKEKEFICVQKAYERMIERNVLYRGNPEGISRNTIVKALELSILFGGLMDLIESIEEDDE